MATRRTRWGGQPTHFCGEHLNLDDLITKEIRNCYLYKENVPSYPKPQFQVSHLKHETGPRGLRGICRDSGFRSSGSSSLVWFDLTVSPEEIRSAERSLLEGNFPQVEDSSSFLWRFATSPAFSEKSMYGSFRFTVPLQDVLNAFSQQFCLGDRPVMRVYRTSVFKQKVQHIVLVHSPHHQNRFSEYPLLEAQPQDAVCSYRDGRFIWRPEAMCETHRYEMEVGENRVNVAPVDMEQFYVWDVVSIALHLEPGEVLRLTKDQLRKHLTYCQKFDAPFMDFRKHHFMDFDEAQLLVKGLWPRSAQLAPEDSLDSHFEVPVCRDTILRDDVQA